MSKNDDFERLKGWAWWLIGMIADRHLGYRHDGR